MTPVFLEYKVIHDNITYYIIYIFIYNLSLKLVTMYTINPNSHTILSYNVSLEPQQIFSNITGISTYYSLDGKKILAYENNNGSIIVAYNGLILKKVSNNSVRYLIAANYPGIDNSKFPNLYKLAKISIFDTNIRVLVLGVLLTILSSFVLKIMVGRYDKVR
ncbi:hypothetical protein [Saccharolobus islandicus]|uniref:Uncharacterized protein n=5 Tax=Saccharolobus islandicus TaxID=43080 RepID=C3MJJ8_SACI2|nr:hypothetical protein [Sulfolobus islandicus]ACP34276.1 conserved hypothetical protein [Sulfolobus islandicus L.S.2.15]ACP37015.1 conserved hypothetical protein [Sulfolobus islandicus M.14.25]ACP54153.1 conserved hypothetical protein [Sulfolobus islandicus M.16.27]ACR40761.1 conserved hypothetical protein [Sulfolobus islandicus M.16.4]ADB85926.1 conserved hypothetical protein [Sulfolobus islandicus L.D.8.5]